MRRLALLPLLVLLAACGDAADAPAGEPLATTEAVADAMLERFRSNVGAVDGFTVYADGAEARYLPSGDTTGMEPFANQILPSGDGPVGESALLLGNQVPNVVRLASGIRAAEFGGVVTRDGRRVYVLTTADPGALFGQPGQAREEGQEFRVYVDAETFDVREIFQSLASDTLATPLTSRLVYDDFREVDGVTLPFTVRQIASGLGQQLNDQEKVVMRGQLGLARGQANQLQDPAEKAEQLAYIDAQQRLIEEGVAETVLTVDSVRVGRPAPAALPASGS